MRLTAPSLPILPASAASNAAQAGTTQRKCDPKESRDNFDELLPESARGPRKRDADAADPSVAEAAMVLSAWTQTAVVTPDLSVPGLMATGVSDDEISTSADASELTDTTSTDVNPAMSDAASANIGSASAVPYGGNAMIRGAASATAAATATPPAQGAGAKSGTVSPTATEDGVPAPIVTTAAAMARTVQSSASLDPAAGIAPGGTTVGEASPSNADAVLESLGTATGVAVPQPVSGLRASQSVAGRSPNASRTGGEKNALGFEGVAKLDGIVVSAQDKKILSTEDEVLKEDVPGVGIDAAKSAADMTSGSNHRSPLVSLDRGILSAFSTSDASAAAATSPASPAADAHRAIDAVLLASERLTTAGQGVNLQFSMSGASLAVRVEMRAGELHATFRTDSPELRAALDQAWHAAAAQDAASPLRMVQPVFAGADASATNDFSQSASQQQQQRETANRVSSGTMFTKSSGKTATSDDSRVSVEPSTGRSFSGSNQHLHAFA